MKGGKLVVDGSSQCGWFECFLLGGEKIRYYIIKHTRGVVGSGYRDHSQYNPLSLKRGRWLMVEGGGESASGTIYD